jgi:hypothetical protein
MPYAPGVQYNPNPIGQGLAGGMADIANAIMQNAQKREEKERWKKTVEKLQPILDQQTGGKVRLDKDTPKEAIPSIMQFADGLEKQAREKPLRDLQLQNEQLRQRISQRELDDAAAHAAALPEAAKYLQTGDARGAMNMYLSKGGRDARTLAELGDLAIQQGKAPKPMPGSQGMRTENVEGVGTIVRDVATGEPISAGNFIRPAQQVDSSTGPEYSKDKRFFRSGPGDEWKAAPGASRDAADVSFDTNLDVAMQKLDEFEKTVKGYGNFETAQLGNPAAKATLDQLPYQLAILTAKIVDPASVAREGEVDAAKKYLIPAGFFTTNKTTLAALNNMRETFKQYKKARVEAKGGDPAAPAASPEGRAALANLYTDADGTQYPIISLRGQRGIKKGGKFYPLVE